MGLHLGTTVDDGQAAQQLGVIDAQLEADHAAHADADQVHIDQAQVFDQRGHVLGEGGDVVALAGLVGAAVAAYVDDDDPVVGGEDGDLVFPIPGTGTQAVDQHHRHAVSVVLVVQLTAVVLEIGHG
ncbi:hypothetical protein FQZ97_1065150 [compost metagenome]